ncbi:MAG: hypothetical protein M3Y87_07050 [Myxococcota bacterium]|nr:hypothetical protein [Myxococcota bacterium]
MSFRRFFVPEELSLLVRLEPHGARASARWCAPTHSVVTLETGRSA